MVELFGRQEINRAFWLITASAAPFWLLMLLFPHQKWVGRICHPFFAPALLGFLYLYMLYVVETTTGLPSLVSLEARAMRQLVHHPLVFLVFWTHLTVLNLFLGMVIFQDARRRGWRAPVELLLSWLLGPPGLTAYGARLLLLRLYAQWCGRKRNATTARLFPEKNRSALPRRKGRS